MANGNPVSTTLPTSDYHCKDCNLCLDTVESLEVHVQYHKENLFMKWGTQNNHNNDTENNNAAKVKTESPVSAPADSSDSMMTKPSPEFQQRATPDTSAQFQHPATPQSYHSAPSPYQNPDQANYSPGPQFANNQFAHSGFTQNQHNEQINWEQSQYNQEYHKAARFHPYSMQDRVSQVSSSSPLYVQPLNQPTPSPSPNQCDKCGFVCDSAVQLSEHCNTAHAGNIPPPTTSAAMPFQHFPSKQYNSGFQNDTKVKDEHEESSDILDLDSHKVVYQGNEGDQPNVPYDQTQTLREVNSRTVPMMPWETQKIYTNPQVNGDVSLFKDQKIFNEQKSFHPDQKFPYAQDKFLSVHHEQKPFMHGDQKMYPGVPMPPLTDYAGTATSSTPDMKPPYRPYDSPAPSQISTSQSASSASATLPPIGGKGANWKSNEARRPKTYNCTACNKWFTSSGHLKRHYNTTLHKNAVRSSGQPDPATMPISSHHHPAREPLQQRAQQQAADSNTQSPAPADDARSSDDVLQAPYSHSYDPARSQRAATMHSKYSHHQQGNIDNNFISNNPLANHPLPHQVGSHPLNIGSQQPGLGNPNDGNPALKSVAISSSGNPPNGEAGPSVTQNHLGGLLSISTSNIITPVLTQSTPTLTAHTLPPFSHLAANPYNPGPMDPLGTSVPDPTHAQLYLGQNFQQTLAPSYPNGMAPHVMDMATSNQHIANPATFGELLPEEVVMECTTSNETVGGRLPSFAQFQSQRLNVYISNNFVTSPNVGGQLVADESSGLYMMNSNLNPSPMSYVKLDINAPKLDYNYDFVSKQIKIEGNHYLEYMQDNPIACHSGEEATRVDSAETAIKMMKIENIMDYANKENYSNQMKSPGSPESAREEHLTVAAAGSPSISSSTSPTLSMPLVESKQIAKSAAPGVPKCYECDKVFNKVCYLTQHNKTFHSGAKPIKCERCGKRYSDDASYEEHFSKHVEDNKPYKCQQCPKSFNHKTDLRRHMCLHSGTKPYPCSYCGKGFIRKDHMLKHHETHMRKSNRTSASP